MPSQSDAETMAVKTCSLIHFAFFCLTRGTSDEFCDLWDFHRAPFGNAKGKIKMNLTHVVTFPLIVSVILLSVAGTAQATIIPSDIAGLELWLDASDINAGGSQPADGAPVTTWMDKSGQNRDAVGGPGNNFDADGLDGFPTVVFDGGSESGFTLGPAAAIGTGNYALFMVLQTTNDRSWLFYNAFGDTGLRYGIAESSGDGTLGLNEQSFNIDHRADTSTLVNDDAVHFSFLHRAGNLGLTDVGVDGVVLNNITKNVNLQTSVVDNDINIARRFAGGNFPYSGNISEVLYYVGDFSAQDRDGINAYLNAKWSPIPEPASGLLLVLGAAGLLVRRRPLGVIVAH
ncbi:MAG: hypothetical protein CMJ81_04785 [Planctomycetaceae bacterium]|nr:hypothetical protein [Planctomycetaceae bacterium]